MSGPTLRLMCPICFSSFTWPTRCGQHVGTLRFVARHQTAEIQTTEICFLQAFSVLLMSGPTLRLMCPICFSSFALSTGCVQHVCTSKLAVQLWTVEINTAGICF